MLRYLRSDATPLSTENIQDIIKAKNSMKRAPEAMANKYKISTRRVYQIWRGVHPPIDSKNSEKKLDDKSIPSSSDLLQEDLNISQEDLIAYYEKEAIRDKKNIAKLKSILGE